MMWYGCLTKQLGGEVVYHCTIFGEVSNMIWDAIYRTMIAMNYLQSRFVSLPSRRYGRLSLYTIRGWNVSPYNLGPSCLSTQRGMVVSLNNSGGYLCIIAIWRYCMVCYGTDGMYHDWYLKSCFLSASQGMVGNNNVSLHNSGFELCIPTIWVLHVYLHNYLRIQILDSHQSSISRHVLIDYVNWYFLCVREIYVSLIMDV